MEDWMSTVWHSRYLVIILEMLGALVLGLMVGYERSYRGRAAGMRTYAFVCMASCAMTSITGNPELWFGLNTNIGTIDPTRVTQGIITGIGFLGAGVIMRDGLSITGLTTAASIWAVSAVGILVGIGFYAPAVALAAILMGVMLWGSKLEAIFPAHHAIAVTLGFSKGFVPSEEWMQEVFIQHGYKLARSSFTIVQRGQQYEWRFIVTSLSREKSASLIQLSQTLANTAGIDSCYFSHSRN